MSVAALVAAVLLAIVTPGVLGIHDSLSAQQVRQQTPPRGQQPSTPAKPQDAAQQPQIVPVQGNVYMITTPNAGNITVQIGDEGVLLVDAGGAEQSEQVLALVRQLSKEPIRYIVNTHFHPDHTGGNETLAKAGATIGESIATIVAHENVLNRMSAPSGEQPPTPIAGWPTLTFFTDDKELFVNGEAVQILHQPAAHTDGDTIVFFRKSDVLSTGDLFVTTTYPVIDEKSGGSIQGVIAGLNHIIDVTITKTNEEDGTLVVPGHGRLCDEADVVEYRNMVTIIRDRIQDLVKKGMTLEQVKAARPTLDYDGRYGFTSGPWTTANFIEAVYRGLSPKKPTTGGQS